MVINSFIKAKADSLTILSFHPQKGQTFSPFADKNLTKINQDNILFLLHS
jgi:hypothetical protein